MPFDGAGNYTPSPAPNFPAVGGAVISSTYYNNVINDIATAFNNCLTRDNQGKPSAHQDWNAKNLTNVAALGAVSGAFSGAVTVGTTLGVTGAVTLAAGLTVGTTLGVTGNATFGGTVGITGALSLTVKLTAGNGGTGVDGSAAANGTLLIGNGAGYTLATLTAGGGTVSITNGAGSITIAVLKVPNTITFNNGGAGDASGTTFDGSAAKTISHNSIGAQPLDADLTDIAAIARTRGDLIVGGAAAWQDLALGASGRKLASDGTDVVWIEDIRCINAVIGDGVNVISTGVANIDIHFPFACVIQEWTLLLDASSTTTVDIWVDSYANYPPTVADTITAAAKPATAAATKNQSSTLTGWTTSIAANSTMRINIDANNNAKRIVLALKVKVS